MVNTGKWYPTRWHRDLECGNRHLKRTAAKMIRLGRTGEPVFG